MKLKAKMKVKVKVKKRCIFLTIEYFLRYSRSNHHYWNICITPDKNYKEAGNIGNPMKRQDTQYPDNTITKISYGIEERAEVELL